MERPFARALLFAWDKPQFRAALQQLIDLDEVTRLLAALADDRESERRLVDLLQSALETPEVREAILVLLDDAAFRMSIVEGLAETEPSLAQAVGAALEDLSVRLEIRQALQSARVRGEIVKVASSQLRGKKARLVLAAGSLLLHRSVRGLLWRLHKHGVLRELNRLNRVR